MDQAPAAFVRFVPQWIGKQIPNNNNGWLEKEPEEEEEEEEDEAMEDDEEDDAEFGNFHVEESSASRDLLKGNSKVCVPGPIPCDLKSVHRGVKREFSELKSQNRRAEELSRWEAWKYASKKKIPNQPSTHPNLRGCRSACAR
nr:hypothetical protein [Tanacetum cinerariifolium]